MALTSTSTIRNVFDDMLDVHELYAQRIRLYQSYADQYPISQSDQIKTHTEIDNLRPQLTNLELLLGITPTAPAWALMRSPQDYDPRRPSFTFDLAAPALGNDEELTAAVNNLQGYIEIETDQQKREKKKILEAIRILRNIRLWKIDIYKRIGQFLQG